ncbi:hypothetical protein J5289_20610 [Rhizobium sp. B230/85]|uniref:hypothetical protein n=1 Tax=unclassified Rhizobium TaxID=2613769 RepID=UPI001ADACFD1|nr:MULTISPECIES: hypothetical protein [unclassified Rhizobium]MBO9135263.1 hypothetical protein [Rhizobium sp. B209b/85]QXZ98926.1 hypothetical protein J5289_20610 [Rhizobium sp. B230/85]
MDELTQELYIASRKLQESPVAIRVFAFTQGATSWDAFAQRCEASFRCAFHASRMWQIDYNPLMRLVRLDIILCTADDQVKIGQCAVGIRKSDHVFCDAIQVLPDYRHLWSLSMRAVLSHLGDGYYRYGSDWCLDKCRSAELHALPGVSVISTAAVDMIAIDFKRWESFDAFYKEVSKNARRNVQKAERSYPGLDFAIRRQWQIFWDLVPLELSRLRLFKKKRILTSRASLVIRSLSRVLTTSKFSFTARNVSGDKTLARFMGITFGPIMFFMEAAAAEDHGGGAASHLLKCMIETAYMQTTGRGMFVFGPDNHENDADPVWQGLARSRLQWQAKSYPISVVQCLFKNGVTDAGLSEGRQSDSLYFATKTEILNGLDTLHPASS